jgi:hypothetical protein
MPCIREDLQGVFAYEGGISWVCFRGYVGRREGVRQEWVGGQPIRDRIRKGVDERKGERKRGKDKRAR